MVSLERRSSRRRTVWGVMQCCGWPKQKRKKRKKRNDVWDVHPCPSSSPLIAFFLDVLLFLLFSIFPNEPDRPKPCLTKKQCVLTVVCGIQKEEEEEKKIALDPKCWSRNSVVSSEVAYEEMASTYFLTPICDAVPAKR